MTYLHFDEAKPAAEAVLRDWLRDAPDVNAALLIVVIRQAQVGGVVAKRP
jgi:hypothetical protein